MSDKEENQKKPSERPSSVSPTPTEDGIPELPFDSPVVSPRPQSPSGSPIVSPPPQSPSELPVVSPPPQSPSELPVVSLPPQSPSDSPVVSPPPESPVLAGAEGGVEKPGTLRSALKAACDYVIKKVSPGKKSCREREQIPMHQPKTPVKKGKTPVNKEKTPVKSESFGSRLLKPFTRKRPADDHPKPAAEKYSKYKDAAAHGGFPTHPGGMVIDSARGSKIDDIQTQNTLLDASSSALNTPIEKDIPEDPASKQSSDEDTPPEGK